MVNQRYSYLIEKKLFSFDSMLDQATSKQNIEYILLEVPVYIRMVQFIEGYDSPKVTHFQCQLDQAKHLAKSCFIPSSAMNIIRSNQDDPNEHDINILTEAKTVIGDMPIPEGLKAALSEVVVFYIEDRSSKLVE